MPSEPFRVRHSLRGGETGATTGLRSGNGEPVILVHGVGMAAEIWAAADRGLEPAPRCHCLRHAGAWRLGPAAARGAALRLCGSAACRHGWAGRRAGAPGRPLHGCPGGAGVRAGASGSHPERCCAERRLLPLAGAAVGGRGARGRPRKRRASGRHRRHDRALVRRSGAGADAGRRGHHATPAGCGRSARLSAHLSPVRHRRRGASRAAARSCARHACS